MKISLIALGFKFFARSENLYSKVITFHFSNIKIKAFIPEKKGQKPKTSAVPPKLMKKHPLCKMRPFNGGVRQPLLSEYQISFCPYKSIGKISAADFQQTRLSENRKIFLLLLVNGFNIKYIIQFCKNSVNRKSAGQNQ